MTRSNNASVILSLSLFLAGCSSLEVKSDRAPGASFSGKKTYAFYQVPAGLKGHTPAQMEFLSERFNPAVKLALARKGYSLGPAESADLFVATQVSVDGYVDAIRWGYSMTQWDPWGPYGGVVYAKSAEYKKAYIVIDVVDGKEKTLVLRGWAEDVLRSRGGDPTQDDLEKLAARMLEKLPSQALAPAVK